MMRAVAAEVPPVDTLRLGEPRRRFARPFNATFAGPIRVELMLAGRPTFHLGSAGE